jgi:hypothetical protein
LSGNKLVGSNISLQATDGGNVPPLKMAFSATLDPFSYQLTGTIDIETDFSENVQTAPTVTVQVASSGSGSSSITAQQ